MGKLKPTHEELHGYSLFIYINRIIYPCQTFLLFKVTSALGNTRRTCQEVFCRKGVLRNFAKSTGEHLYQSLFFNKVAGLRPKTLLKKRLWHRCFPVKNIFFCGTPPVAASVTTTLYS